MLKLFTIGYEGTDVARIVETLAKAGVHFVADIRERPLSRKPGFSKTALQNTLAAHHIGYQHFRDLGDPKEGRQAAKSGDYVLFQNIYARQFASIEAARQLQALISVARSQATCLLCFEKEPAKCHRTIVAKSMAREGFTTVNLFTDRNSFEHGAIRKQPGRHLGQGVTAT